MSKVKWLSNVKLETGERMLDNGTVETETALFHLKIENGKIVEQLRGNEKIPVGQEVIDMKQKLAVPTFKEMHNHLDKTYMTLDWKACIPVSNLKERLAFEAAELTSLSDTAQQRATKMIEALLEKGSTHIRTHVNIDPYIGLKNLEGVTAALETFKGKVTADIIAFPQHGLLRESVPSLMREAMRSGATMVGGLDPAGIDNAIEKSLFETMDIATEFNADVDIHLHDGGFVGYYTADKWIDIVEDANYKGRTALSHSFCLGDIPVPQQELVATRLAEQDVAIMSTIPINLGRIIPPIDLLDAHGVKVHFGCDGFYDSWSPYGTGDVLEKATRFCELTRKIDEKSLRNSLKWVTGGIVALNDDGQKVWPNIQDDASFVFFDAVSSAEVVARKPNNRLIMVMGELLS
ncbi:amidohydrolase [Paenisporosarcina sp. OV554]|uniref:amidohydrolase n=1 Tax=Paenisporosarcina sp. OV554 TaxID=2135694 RepID=UPI000D363DC0|nr:amidohydrolase [Paenisporosarcina sp. OV554]PUB09577.1 cytosine/adenosine deaminase-related metal-dependent hydrolase [Paenisporosarcina sp. OV554]